MYCMHWLNFTKIKLVDERRLGMLQCIFPSSAGESLEPFINLTKQEAARLHHGTYRMVSFLSKVYCNVTLTKLISSVVARPPFNKAKHRRSLFFIDNSIYRLSDIFDQYKQYNNHMRINEILNRKWIPPREGKFFVLFCN